MDKEQIRKEWEEGRLIAPQSDIYETQDAYVLQCLMPGVTKDVVQVSLTDGELIIYAETNRTDLNCDCYVLREIEDGNYYRVFKVGDSVDVEKISAKVEHGVLRVQLPKHDRVKPREIPIEAV